jgi:hypothetical protein
MLAKVTDPRHRRGVRYRLVVILGLAVCAVLAGARSFTAIAEWAADADQDTLQGLGVTGAVPSESSWCARQRHRGAHRQVFAGQGVGGGSWLVQWALVVAS